EVLCRGRPPAHPVCSPECSSPRRSSKNDESSRLASLASTPGVTGSSWLSLGSVHRLYSDPQAPDLGSGAPNTSRPTRPATSAPAHIGQGSRVTYNVAPVSRQEP